MSACHQAAAVGGGQQDTPGASPVVSMLSLFDNALGGVCGGCGLLLLSGFGKNARLPEGVAGL